MSSKSQTPQIVALTAIDRITMVTFMILEIVLFVLFNYSLSYYLGLPIPAILPIASLRDSPYTEPAYFYNASLFGLFFLQHICMALLKFKVGMKKLWPKYALYERFIYNNVSCLLYLIVLYLSRPISTDKSTIFIAPFYLTHIIMVIAVGCLISTLIQMWNRMFFPYSLSQVMSSKTIKLQEYNLKSDMNLQETGLYSIVRHPMAAANSVMFIFSSNVYTVDRLIFIAVSLLGSIVGTYYEEKRLRNMFKKYAEYSKKVPYKLIPYLY